MSWPSATSEKGKTELEAEAGRLNRVAGPIFSTNEAICSCVKFSQITIH